MSLTAGEIIWKINGDASGFNSSVKRAHKSAKGLGSSWKSVGLKIAGAFAAIGAVRFIKSLIKAGSDAEEVGQKFGVVFSTVAAEANAMAASISANYGLSRTESKQLLSDTGDLLSGFGLTGKASLELSGKVQRLAADLASFSNVQGGIKFASQALTKGLFGETEQMKSLGIVINQNSAEFKGLVKNYIDVEGKTLLQAKALTILQMATEQSKNAIGDFARSMSSYANQSRIAEANIANLKETLGTKLLPIAALGIKAFNAIAVELDKSAQKMGKFVTSAKGAEQISTIIGKMAGTFAAAKVIISPIIDHIVDVVKILVGTFKDLIGPSADAGGAFTFFSSAVTLGIKVSKVIVLVMAAMVRTLVNMIKIVVNSGKTIASFYMALAGKGEWKDVVKNIKETGGSIKKLGTGIVDDATKVVNAIGDVTGSFSKDSAALSKKAAIAYKKTSADISKAVLDALLAKQKLAEANKKEKKDNDKNKKSVKGLKDEYVGLTGTLRDLAVWFDKTADSNKALVKVLGQIGQVASDASGFLGSAFSGISDLAGAIGNSQIAALDAQMKKEIEAAGVSEETQKQKLENEIAAAQAAGDSETEIAKQKELARFEIQEKYAKKRAQIEYKLAVLQWSLQLATAIATAPLTILNAVTSGFKLGAAGAIIYGALAAAAAGIQIAAVAAAKPTVPSFQGGGYVPGNSIAGDNMAVRANSGELILDGAQQRRLLNTADGKTQGSQGGGVANIYLGDRLIYKSLYKATKNGDLLIDSRSVVSK